jgi:hypothetical protein
MSTIIIVVLAFFLAIGLVVFARSVIRVGYASAALAGAGTRDVRRMAIVWGAAWLDMGLSAAVVALSLVQLAAMDR